MAAKKENVISSFSGKYRFLSNFYLKPVMFEGEEYPSTEHAYQAAKALPTAVYEEKDDSFVLWRDAIRFAATCGLAKKMGSKEGYKGKVLPIRPGWEEGIKLDVMRAVLREKFAVGSEEAEMLMETGDALLIEGNTWGDTYWGVCKGTGHNYLGKLLMERRDELFDTRDEAALSEDEFEKVESMAMQATIYFVDKLKESGIRMDKDAALTLLGTTALQCPPEQWEQE